MNSFATRIEIAAAPEAIWSLLTDAPGYPKWNSTVERIDGTISPGNKLKVFTAASPGRAFPLTVSHFEPPKRMVWSGGMPLGLFKGERTYQLTAIGGGKTEFAMREAFTGVLAPMITKSIPDLQRRLTHSPRT